MDEGHSEQIRKQAKSILDQFAAAFEGVSIKERAFKKEVSGFREEGEPGLSDNDFRERMFANAPHVSGDAIIAESKRW